MGDNIKYDPMKSGPHDAAPHFINDSKEEITVKETENTNDKKMSIHDLPHRNNGQPAGTGFGVYKGAPLKGKPLVL